jgi:hypothetical protein
MIKRKRIIAGLAAILMAWFGLSVAAPAKSPVAPPPAAASISYNIMICASALSFTTLYEHDIDGSSNPGHFINADPDFAPTQCTPWLDPTGIRVDTDPYGPSHSYKLAAVGPGSDGSWSTCHTNSDNHASNPPQSSSGAWKIWYKNFDNGDCTN